MSEWKAFGAFAIEYLGMPVEAMPFGKSDTVAKTTPENYSRQYTE
jgi:hypothetical protein